MKGLSPCTYRYLLFWQESAEDIGGGLPFLADLTLGLSVVAYTMLSLLYDGLPISKEELVCQHLLKSKLLQR